MSRRILVGYDGSEAAVRALDRAAEEARAHHGRITVLAVNVMPLDPDAPRAYGTMGDIGAWEGEPYEAPQAIVDDLVAARDHLGAAGLGCELAWAEGTPARAIVDAAQAMHADVIIIGNHHHSALGRFFGTDTADSVRKDARCQVVVA